MEKAIYSFLKIFFCWNILLLNQPAKMFAIWWFSFKPSLKCFQRLSSEKPSQVRSKLLLLNIQFICQTLFIVYDHRGSDRNKEQWMIAREFYQTQRGARHGSRLGTTRNFCYLHHWRKLIWKLGIGFQVKVHFSFFGQVLVLSRKDAKCKR